ncbi:MAG: sigma-70 family RNA polymerase sigma factor [Kiritimatiellae bacterium]|nr:sigma-70 family RNA polymerase sigma factor [Kiritimatiellia bacterium]
MAQSADDIVRQVIAGDTNAYAAIVEQYRSALWQLVTAYVRNRAQAEDIVQRAFVKAYFALERYEQGRDFGVWLKTIAKNEVRTALRKGLTHRQKLAGFAEQLELEHAASALEDDRLARMKRYLEDCLGQLPESSRTILQARYLRESPTALLAEELGRSADAVRQILSRARTSLRVCIEAKAARHA